VISTIINQRYTTAIMLTENGVAPTQHDVETYCEVVRNGRLYEYLQEQLTAQDGINSEIKTRQELKKIMFTVMFSDNRFIGQEAATPKRLFKNTFPTVYELFAYIKRKDKTVLPILLQRIESKLVLDRIAKRIAHERPELPIFTIHDSVITTVGNESYIERIMKEEMERTLGIIPSLATEYWTPLNIDEATGLKKDLKKVA
jgi:hypothetical protein